MTDEERDALVAKYFPGLPARWRFIVNWAMVS